MLPGVRPIIRFASTPTATIWPVLVFSATTDGSFRTIPRPRTYTRVFAVPRSTAMSRPRNENDRLSRMGILPFPSFGGRGVLADVVFWRASGVEDQGAPDGPSLCVNRPEPHRYRGR